MSLCQCGCGEPSPVPRYSDRSKGWTAGQPRPYRKGHHPIPERAVGSRNANWRGDDAGYHAIHMWLSAHYPKVGVCEECQYIGVTEYADLTQGDWPRDREYYMEMCVPCHRRFDATGRGSRGLVAV